jgi:hypothetical protein
MDLEKLRQAGEGRPNEDIIRDIFARLPNELEIFTDTLTSVKITPSNQIKPVNKEYTFGYYFQHNKKPEGIFLNCYEAYWYVLDEDNKTISQVPKYSSVLAQYYPIHMCNVTSNKDGINLSEVVPFKTTTISVTDTEIKEFKRYVKAHNGYSKDFIDDYYDERVVKDVIPGVFKSIVDNIPEKITTTEMGHHFLMNGGNFWVMGYWLYLEGNDWGMRLLAEREVKKKVREAIGEFDHKQLNEGIINALSTADLGDALENLFYEFFTESYNGKQAQKFNLSIGVYFDEDDEDGEEEPINGEYQGSNLVIKTNPIKVFAEITKEDYMDEFSSFDKMDFYTINIPDVVIPVSENVINHKKDVNLFFGTSGTIFSHKLEDQMRPVIKEKLMDNKIKVLSNKYQRMGWNFPCEGVSFTIQNPLMNGD